MGTTTHASMSSDPIHAVLRAHREAWDAFQVAPVGEHSERAEAAMEAALEAVLSTGCETQHGAICLLTHLRWWLTEERDFADSYQPSYAFALARACDLTLLLGGRPWSVTGNAASDAETETSVEPSHLGGLAAGIVRHLAVVVPYCEATAGELLTAGAVVVGGMWLTGLASLL